MVKIRLAALVTVTLVSTLLSDVARAQPSTGDAHFRKGLDYASDGNFEQARDEFVRALKLAPVSSVAAAGVQQSLRLIERLGRGENKAAAMALYRGLRLVNADAPDKAIDEFNRALSIQRNLHEARSLRGAAYTAVGRYQEGLADRSKAIEDDPTDVWALVNRSMAYVLGTHEYNLAVADCDRALELLSPRDPMRALVHLNRGRARSENRDYMGAESDYTAALALDANLVYAYVKQEETARRTLFRRFVAPNRRVSRCVRRGSTLVVGCANADGLEERTLSRILLQP